MANKKKFIQDPDAYQTYLISLAQDEAERRIKDGSAPASLLIHYLKLGTKQSQIELEKMELEKELIKVKTENYKAAISLEDVCRDAIEAITSYRGGEEDEELPPDDDFE